MDSIASPSQLGDCLRGIEREKEEEISPKCNRSTGKLSETAFTFQQFVHLINIRIWFMVPFFLGICLLSKKKAFFYLSPIGISHTPTTNKQKLEQHNIVCTVEHRGM